MKNNRMLALSFVAGILVTLLVPIILLVMGAINTGADVNPGLIKRAIAPWARDRSVENRAPKGKGAYDGDLAAVATGLDHYRQNCMAVGTLLPSGRRQHT